MKFNENQVKLGLLKSTLRAKLVKVGSNSEQAQIEEPMLMSKSPWIVCPPPGLRDGYS